MTYLPKPYVIKDIKEFTKDVKLFKVECGLNPNPGQFMEVSIPGIGECALASCFYESNEVCLLTRKAGNVTSKLFELKKGDNLFIRGAYGKGFPLKELENKNLLLVAGGTGIAPVTSLINYIEKNRTQFKEIYIYLGFRNKDYILLKDEIKKWKKKFKVIVCLDKNSGGEVGLGCETGFVHEVMKKYGLLTKQVTVVMCGPEIMMQSVTKVLNGFDIANNDIYWSMERRMECGIGNCNRCLIQDLYVCRDGPVFRYDIIKLRLDNENSNNEK